jgi:hypothetical protein
MCASFAVQAATVVFVGALNPAAEVPPKNSPATGTVQATLDTVSNQLHYVVNYKDLTGPATAAHFHGPAAAGVNAGVAVGVKGSVSSPISGDATLTAEQSADLMSGKWYFNVHTAANPGGEIRGQMELQK